MKLSKEQSLFVFLIMQALILLCFYFPWLSNSSSYFFRDLTHYNEPFARFTGNLMRNFEIPMWNPWTYCGMPQIAISVQGVFYPATSLFAVMPFSSALAASMILHQLILAAGGFLLVLGLGWGILPAIICGITLAMSGYEFCFTSIFSLVESSAWCPLSIWAIQRLGVKTFEMPNAADNRISFSQKEVGLASFVLALLVAMHILAGHPELGAIEFGLLGAYTVFSAWQERRRGNSQWKIITGWRIRAIFLGVLIAMPAILPAFEWLGLSRRSAGLDPHEALILSANWYDLLGLALPQPLGDMQARWSEFRPLVMSGQLLPYMASAFVGPAVITMAIWSLFDQEWKERWFIVALTIFVLLLAMGGNTPLVPFILSIAKSSIRFPVKLMFFVVFGISVMASRGIYSCVKARLDKAWLGSLLAWTLFGVLGLLVLCKIPVLDLLLDSNSMPGELRALIPKASAYIGNSALLASAIGIVMSLARLAHQKWSSKLKFVPHLMIGFTAISLLSFAFEYCRCPGPGDFFEQPSIVASELGKLRMKDQTAERGRILELYLEHFTVPQSYLSLSRNQATINNNLPSVNEKFILSKPLHELEYLRLLYELESRAQLQLILGLEPG
ncbi:MAG: hypothetical protein K2X81_04155, partial [Candidatus Obscuribacterales bacterium]|nr:hypothetical protein [Candidatus Obscuribacterales bacterium]